MCKKHRDKDCIMIQKEKTNFGAKTKTNMNVLSFYLQMWVSVGDYRPPRTSQYAHVANSSQSQIQPFLSLKNFKIVF
jgi:hypothetical protein